MNQQTITNINEESLDVPSFPAYMNNKDANYYVDGGGIEEDNEENEESGQENSPEEPQDQTTRMTRIVGQFLRLPIERVSKNAKK